jgi:hypothetical protein
MPAKRPVMFYFYDRSDFVPSDPREYRVNAARCAELAVAARSHQLKVALVELSKNWEKLAISLEGVFSILDEIEVTKSGVGDS